MVGLMNRIANKRCSTCKIGPPQAHFARNRQTADGLQNECDPCRQRRQRNWWHKKKAEDPDFLKKSAAYLRSTVLIRDLKRYGLTRDEYDSLVAKGCAICGGPPNGKGRYALDHDHKTNKFRGLLCSSCNVAIGLFKESQDVLTRAKQYLLEHSE
jgi:Recombination endonuclease VII